MQDEYKIKKIFATKKQLLKKNGKTQKKENLCGRAGSESKPAEKESCR